jgi:hypothetical protein
MNHGDQFFFSSGRESIPASLNGSQKIERKNGNLVWVTTGSLNTVRDLHTATLLANGKVLVTGGYNGGYLASAELYDVGLGFNNTWQPQIATFTSPLAANGCLTLTGSRF